MTTNSTRPDDLVCLRIGLIHLIVWFIFDWTGVEVIGGGGSLISLKIFRLIILKQ